jgi:hypothetical protein
MAISRSFRVLSLYDIVANLLPGALVPVVTVVLFPWVFSGIGSSGGLAVGGFVIISYVSGLVLQAIGSWRDHPTTFSKTLDAACGSNSDDSPIKVTHVEESFWPLSKRAFSLPDDFENKGRLFKLVLSYLETTPTNRALRFQALYSLYRSIWVAAWVTVVFTLIKVVLTIFGIISQANCIGPILSIQFGFLAQYPALPSTYVCSVDLLVGVLAVGGVFVFGNRKEHFDKVFIKYVFIDFYNDRVTDSKINQRGK